MRDALKGTLRECNVRTHTTPNGASATLNEQVRANVDKKYLKSILTDDQYDLVWFVAPDSYAASNAASSGAFVLSESYLYTQEMLEESIQHLTGDGMVVMQFGEKNYEARPNRTARLAATAREAYESSGVGPFTDHVAVVTSVDEGFLYGGSTTMLKTSPFTDDELDAVGELARGLFPNTVVGRDNLEIKL